MRNWFSRILSALGALIFFAVLGGFLVSPVQTVKCIGAPFLVLPAAVGLIPSIGPTEVQAISLLHPAPEITIVRPGQYAIYADEDSVLMRANMLEAATATWITVQAAPDGGAIPGSNVVRGVLPYDSVVVPGRPIATFAIATPGRYTLAYPIQSGTVYFAPDTTTGREGVIAFAVIAQIAIIVASGLGMFWPRIRQSRLQQRQFSAKLAQKRMQTEAFWQQRGQNRADAHESEGKKF